MMDVVVVSANPASRRVRTHLALDRGPEPEGRNGLFRYKRYSVVCNRVPDWRGFESVQATVDCAGCLDWAARNERRRQNGGAHFGRVPAV